MDYREIYKSKLTTPDEAVKLVKDGWGVAVPVAVGQPPVLINALARRQAEFTKLDFWSVVDVYPTEMLKIERNERIEQDYSYCVASRKGEQQGQFVYTPIRLGEGPRILTRRKYQVVMLQVAPMDEYGYFSMGVSCDYTHAFMREAEVILVQVNENMPRTFGRNSIHVSKVGAIVEATHPLAALPSVSPNDNEKLIGQYVADLVEDGSTIQLGIGGIPNAAAMALESKKDLGVHTEMIADANRILWEKGAINNSHKTYMPDVMVATFAMGSQDLYEWLDENPIVHFYPTELVNDPYIIAQHEKMVSINSTLEMDLSGQACSESIGPVQYTHTGGQADFILGACRSRGGKSIIAFESVADTQEGPISKIVPHLRYGSFITAARYETHYVVTEYGVADIKYQNIWERSKRLINIAHPDFRDRLRFEAKKANLI
ncbi:MAG: acetyl-CoA hydrolase/transferase C-terminal domain-containing protein [Syntrophomonadaceae bacterium]